MPRDGWAYPAATWDEESELIAPRRARGGEGRGMLALGLLIGLALGALSSRLHAPSPAAAATRGGELRSRAAQAAASAARGARDDDALTEAVDVAACGDRAGRNAGRCAPDVVVELPVEQAVYNPAGYERVVLTYGKMMTGPVVRATLDDVVEVRAENRMQGTVTTVHHHGIHQLGTPFFDGAMAITQAGIPPGGTMRYKFRAEPVGTHWYHSHTGGQYGDGLHGAFIVEDPNDPYKPYYTVDEVLVIAELSHQTTLMATLFYDENPSMKPGEGDDDGGLTYAAGLINGKTAHADAAYVVHVPAFGVARLRVVCASWDYRYALEIEDHHLTIIAVQGTYVRPRQTGSVGLHAAERYDVIATPRPGSAAAAAHAAGNATLDYQIRFYARIHGTGHGARMSGPETRARAQAGRGGGHNHSVPSLSGVNVVNATLRYHAATKSEARAKDAPAPLPRDVDADAAALWTPTDFKLDTALEPKPPQAKAPDREVPLVITAQFPGQQKRVWKAEWPDSPTAAWSFNNNTWADPTTPLYVSKGDPAHSYARVANAGERAFGPQLVSVKLGETVDIVVINDGLGSTPEIHPLHFHGHKFWVVAMADLPWPVDQRERPPYNLDDPVLVDTLPVPTGQYAVLRFVASNPGMWHFHCHLVTHMEEGLQVVFNVAEEHQPAPTDAWYDGQTLDRALCPAQR